MKADDILERGPGLSEKDIADFEDLITSRLPTDYRAFLLATNGGEPPEGTGWFKMKTSTPRKWSHLRFSYGLRRPDVTGWVLGQALLDFKDSVNPKTIPIATDEYGNQILLVVRGARTGAVYFWSHEWEEPDIRLASCFTDFLDQLQHDPDAAQD